MVIGMMVLTASCLWASPSQSWKEGLEYGTSHAGAIRQNVEAMFEKAQSRGADLTSFKGALTKQEALWKEILPQKIEWLQGAAQGAQVAYEDLLAYNALDRQIAGFMGECTTFIAHGTALEAKEGSFIAKNRDLGAQTISEVAVEEARDFGEKDLYGAAYIDIPQVKHTYRFVGSRSAGRWGYGMGINEKQVIVADNDAPTRDALAFMEGLHDNDYVRLLLERAGTAREGVEILAALTSRYGQAWNSIMFEIADPKELWVVEVSGYRWVAKKYENTYTARSNQFEITDDYDLAAEDLISFAVSQGWVPEGTERINFRKVYGGMTLYPNGNENLKDRPAAETRYNTEKRYQRAMELLKGIEGSISAKSILPLVRDHYDTYTLPSGKILELDQVPFYSSSCVEHKEWILETPEKDTVEKTLFPRGICHHAFGGITASSAILQARPDIPDSLGVMIHCIMQPCNSLFVPFYVSVPVDSRFSSNYAGSLFMTISKLAFGAYTLHHSTIRSIFDPYEENLWTSMKEIEEEYQNLLGQGKTMEAHKKLWNFEASESQKALDLAHKAIKAMFEKSSGSSAWTRGCSN